LSIFKRGEFYSYNFFFNGRHIQGSTKTANRKAARDIESAARTALARGEWDLEKKEKPDPTLRELFDGLERHFKHSPKWGPKHKSNLKLVRRAFPGALKSSLLQESTIDRYIAKKLRKHRKAATINRPLQLLKEAYHLANLVPPCKIRHLSEAGNVRPGFFEAAEFDSLLKHLPADLHDFCRFARLTAWRKNEIASLTWADIEGDTIRLRGVFSKNGNARSVPLNIGELQDIIERRRKLRHNRFNSASEPIFHRGDGKKILEFRKSWRTACKAAGIPGRLFHDFRRTGVRNLIRAGVPQSVAMRISGHETTKMFDRYNIVDDGDLRSAMQSLEQHHAKVAATASATNG
jgi:integrase